MQSMVSFVFLLIIGLISFAQAEKFNFLSPEADKLFFDGRDIASVWSDEDVAALVTALGRLDRHGLNPDHYHRSELAAGIADRQARARVATDSWFSAAAHMVYGKLSPETLEPDWTAAGRKADLPGILRDALLHHSIEASLELLAPKQPTYMAMVDELARLRALTPNPETSIPEGATLRPGDHGPRVSSLQARLGELGLLQRPQTSGVFDTATKAALQAFQASLDLDSDGVAGAPTIRALNRGLEEKIAQVRVNLERWRWLPEDLGRRHVRVNIAGFSLATWSNGVPVRVYPVIIGKIYRMTPVFSDNIRYIIFNPWWETPPSIARRDKLPVFRKDPGAVKRLGFEILDSNGTLIDPDTINWSEIKEDRFPFQLRQMPGPDNALGKVKIIFPNKHNVYIHDTPTKTLFSQHQRAFSSGCIRTQYPLDLAEWLLEETPGWKKPRIDEIVGSGKETQVNLSSLVPVHILYLSVTVEPNGTVRYLDDVYDRDSAVLQGLNKVPN